MSDFQLEIYPTYDGIYKYKWKLKNLQGSILREGNTESKCGAKIAGKKAKRLVLEQRNNKSKPEIYDIMSELPAEEREAILAAAQADSDANGDGSVNSVDFDNEERIIRASRAALAAREEPEIVEMRPSLDEMAADHDERMRAAEKLSEWHLGSPGWADVLVGAYLHPTETMEILRTERERNP